MEEEPEDLDAQLAEFEATMEEERGIMERRARLKAASTGVVQPVISKMLEKEKQGFSTDMFDFEPEAEASCEFT